MQRCVFRLSSLTIIASLCFSTLFAAAPASAASKDLLWYYVAVGEETSEPLGSFFTARNPDIHLTSRRFPAATSKNDLLAATVSLVPPDLVSLDFDPIFEAAVASGKLKNLTALWDKHSLWDRIPSVVTESCLHPVHREPQAVPMFATEVMVTYRISAFAKAGITAPPTTWDEFVSTLRALRASGAQVPLLIDMQVDDPTGIVEGVPIGLTWIADLVMSRAFGDSFHSDISKGKINVVEDSRLKDVLITYLTPLFLEGLIYDAGSFNNNLGAFAVGVGAMYFGGTFISSALLGIDTRLYQDLNTFVMPTITPGVKRYEIFPFRAYAIPAAASAPVLAEKFFEDVLLVKESFDTLTIGGIPYVTPLLDIHLPYIQPFPLNVHNLELVTSADGIFSSMVNAAESYRDAFVQVLLAATTYPPGFEPEGFSASRAASPSVRSVLKAAGRTVTSSLKMPSAQAVAASRSAVPAAMSAIRSTTRSASADPRDSSSIPRPDTGRLHTEQSPDIIEMGLALMKRVDDALAQLEAERVATILGRVAAPTADPSGGVFDASVVIELDVPLDIPGVNIHYTLDGTVPTDQSIVYSEPIRITSSGDFTLRAVAIGGGLKDSDRITARYSITATGMSLVDTLTMIVAPSAAGALILILIAVFIVRRRLAQAKASQWRIDPTEVTVNREKILGVGSFGIVYEGTFRGSPVAVKELYLSPTEFKRQMTKINRSVHDAMFNSVAMSRMRGGSSSKRHAVAPGDKPAPKSSQLYKDDGDQTLTTTSHKGDAWTRSDRSMDGLLSTTNNNNNNNNNNNSNRLTTSMMMTGLSSKANTDVKFNAAKVRHDFAAEVAVISALRHPNTIFLLGAYLTRTSATLIVEKMNSSVYDLLQAPTVRLSARRRVEIAVDVASGLAYLHSHKPPILHRDLKSMNLLVGDRGEVKVSDFGLSEISGKKSRTIGSAPWTSPEVFENPRSYTTKSDIYSFGIVLYELATSKEPWISNVSSIKEIAENVSEGARPVIPETLPISMPDSFMDVMRSCWAQDPANRPTIDVALDSLRKCLEETPEEEANGSDASLLNSLVGPTRAQEMLSLIKSGSPVPQVPVEKSAILFADIAGYTDISSRYSSATVTAMLQRNFDIFDSICEKYGLTTIDRIGDCVIIGAGIKISEREGAPADIEGTYAMHICEAALEMIESTRDAKIDPDAVETTSAQAPETVRWRIGVATGSLTATVVGREQAKVQFVGDVLNTASRMESNGAPGRIQVTEKVYRYCSKAKDMKFVRRGTISVKGKGEMTTYWCEQRGGAVPMMSEATLAPIPDVKEDE